MPEGTAIGGNRQDRQPDPPGALARALTGDNEGDKLFGAGDEGGLHVEHRI